MLRNLSERNRINLEIKYMESLTPFFLIEKHENQTHDYRR